MPLRGLKELPENDFGFQIFDESFTLVPEYEGACTIYRGGQAIGSILANYGSGFLWEVNGTREFPKGPVATIAKAVAEIRCRT